MFDCKSEIMFDSINLPFHFDSSNTKLRYDIITYHNIVFLIVTTKRALNW